MVVMVPLIASVAAVAASVDTIETLAVTLMERKNLNERDRQTLRYEVSSLKEHLADIRTLSDQLAMYSEASFQVSRVPDICDHLNRYARLNSTKLERTKAARGWGVVEEMLEMTSHTTDQAFEWLDANSASLDPDDATAVADQIGQFRGSLRYAQSLVSERRMDSLVDYLKDMRECCSRLSNMLQKRTLKVVGSLQKLGA